MTKPGAAGAGRALVVALVFRMLHIAVRDRDGVALTLPFAGVSSLDLGRSLVERPFFLGVIPLPLADRIAEALARIDWLQSSAAQPGALRSRRFQSMSAHADKGRG